MKFKIPIDIGYFYSGINIIYRTSYEDSNNSIYGTIEDIYNLYQAIYINDISIVKFNIYGRSNILSIRDSSYKDFVPVKYIIRKDNIDDWYRLDIRFNIISQKRSQVQHYIIYATSNTILPVVNRGGVKVKNLCRDDKLVPFGEGVLNYMYINKITYIGKSDIMKYGYNISTISNRFDADLINSYGINIIQREDYNSDIHIE